MVVLVDGTNLCHAFLQRPCREPRSSSRTKWKIEAAQQGSRFIVGVRRRADGHVHAPDFVDIVVVDFRKHDVLPKSQREVAATIETLGIEAPEVFDPRQGNGHQAIKELVHAIAAQRYLGTDRHAVAQFVGSDRLARAGDDRTLARDQRQVLGRRVHLLAVVHGLTDAHIEHDLLDARDLHPVLVTELLGHLLAHHLFVMRLETGPVVLGPGGTCGVLRLGCSLAGRLALALGCALLALARFFRPRLAAAFGRLGRPGPLRAGLLGFGGLCGFIVFGHGYLFSAISSPERLATRTLRPSGKILKPTLVGLPSLGSSSARFDRWIDASLAMMPPSWDGDWRWCRRTILTPRTSARPSRGITW